MSEVEPGEQQLPFGLSRETSIVRTPDGRWFHEGEPIENPKLARAFDRWVTRAEDGRWCLKNEINWAYFQLEGAPYFVRGVRIEAGRAQLWLSSERWVELDPYSLREGPDEILYCQVEPGEAARFESHAAVQLGDLLEEDAEGPFFRVGEARIRPPRVEHPLDYRPLAREPAKP
jgi:hypothetical protein